MNTNPVMFSVVIPAYNRAGLIERAIKSILLQSYTNVEIIVVDDGSTDNTKEVVSRFNHANLKYIYQENRERGAARNNGVKNAHGAYVVFLDSDDFLYPEF